ncbi:MAG: SDR family oxidoreductase [Deltaproteobacteria bacterium]|nr:SDR family oxidoreductase [Deltaproteobacteria bacterium]MBW2360023.1 SDR family oxidoreductase [Deltaproteobacteria bacterium]
MARLDGKVALVTGAASGIGAATALRFAQEGARVVGFDLKEAFDGDWSEAVRTAPGSHFATGDVRDAEAVAAVVAQAIEKFGRVDVLMNAAGVAGGGPIHLISIEEWDRVVDINLKGSFIVARAVVPQMLEQGAGSVINVASVEGIEGFEGGSAYNASKGGVMLLTRNMAIDYARRGIRVNTVCPGFIETPLLADTLQTPGLEKQTAAIRDAHQLGRFGKPVEIANAALFLASDEASFVTGHALVVDGGYTAGHRFGITELMGLS